MIFDHSLHTVGIYAAVVEEQWSCSLRKVILRKRVFLFGLATATATLLDNLYFIPSWLV